MGSDGFKRGSGAGARVGVGDQIVRVSQQSLLDFIKGIAGSAFLQGHNLIFRNTNASAQTFVGDNFVLGT